jgi:hypothetical protein
LVADAFRAHASFSRRAALFDIRHQQRRPI